MVGYSVGEWVGERKKEKQQQQQQLYIQQHISNYVRPKWQSSDSEVWLQSFIHSTWFPAAEFINQVWIHVFSVIRTACKEEPQSFYANVVDGVVSLVEFITC